ncbi:MAG: hypothetical protein A2Z72_02140, partial [Omnitrophica bacterium RBG_13_46_9]
MRKINFLMCLHCHQPADNFERTFEGAYNRSYEPFVAVLERHPEIKISIHYSGSILEWLVKNKPDFVDRIKKLLNEGRVEIISGGYFEPILPMIPPRDAKGQIEMLDRLIETRFRSSARGIWIAERVWDPRIVPSIFSGLNARYAVLDDFHLRQAGVKDEDVFGYYSVRGANNFFIFASVKKLRYAMPFREPEVTVDFLKSLSENPRARCVTFADDGEKFGFWPYTYDWVYKRGWLENFFTKIEKNDWIKTLTFTEALRETECLGEVDVPRSSYDEMVQWSGGDFDNFFKKYPESDLMRRRMLYVSRMLEEREAVIAEKAVPRDEEGLIQALEEARKEVYKSQSNCAYWHGVFSGVYASYLRQGIYKHIIKADDLLREKVADEEIEMIDLSDPGEKTCSSDSKNESGPGGACGKKSIICARNKFLTLFLDPDYAGTIFEIDYKPIPFNLVNTMSRRFEPYHNILKRRNKIDMERLGGEVKKDQIIDLYEILGVKERKPIRFLSYDSYRKFSLICHAMSPKTSFAAFTRSAHADLSEGSLLGSYNHEVKDEKDRLVINLQRDATVRLISG